MRERAYAIYRFARQNGAVHPPLGLDEAFGDAIRIDESELESFKKRYDDEVRATALNTRNYLLVFRQGASFNGHRLSPEGSRGSEGAGTIDELLALHYDADVPFSEYGDTLEITIRRIRRTTQGGGAWSA